LTAEGTTWKGTGSISCEVEFCIFYRLSLRTLRTKDVIRAVTFCVCLVYRLVIFLEASPVPCVCVLIID
jgi:hypothetical protein